MRVIDLTMLILGAASCAAAGETESAAGPGSGGGGGAVTSSSSGGNTTAATVGSGGGVPGCREEAEQMHLLGFDLSGPVLLRFDPPTVTTQELGPLQGCPAGTGFAGRNPWAAALDREGTIWAHYLEYDHDLGQFVYDRVHTIDPLTGACTDTGAGFSHPGGKTIEYGMAFVPDPAAPTTDILYATALSTAPLTPLDPELVTIDLATFTVQTVGPLRDTGLSFLTSTGQSQLFSFYKRSATGLQELDPATGSPLAETPITGLASNPQLGPLAFWGGALWLFEMAEYLPQSLRTDVKRIDMTTFEAVTVAELDLIVTAAAVSSCAPLEVPK